MKLFLIKSYSYFRNPHPLPGFWWNKHKANYCLIKKTDFRKVVPVALWVTAKLNPCAIG